MPLKINSNWNQEPILSPSLSETEIKILIVNGALKYEEIKRAIKENNLWVVKGPHKDKSNNTVVSLFQESSGSKENYLLNLHIKKKTFDNGDSWIFDNRMGKGAPPESIILNEKPDEQENSWTQLLSLKNKLNSQ